MNTQKFEEAGELIDFDPDEFANLDLDEEMFVLASAVDSPTLSRLYAPGTQLTMSTFSDFLLKPELLRAIEDCGFEHPSQGSDQDLYDN